MNDKYILRSIAEAACERLMQEIDKAKAENARLKAEVERLRKAGDVMLLALWLGVDKYSKEEKEKAEDAWLDAKEGKPSV